MLNWHEKDGLASVLSYEKVTTSLEIQLFFLFHNKDYRHDSHPLTHPIMPLILALNEQITTLKKKYSQRNHNSSSSLKHSDLNPTVSPNYMQ